MKAPLIETFEEQFGQYGLAGAEYIVGLVNHATPVCRGSECEELRVRLQG